MGYPMTWKRVIGRNHLSDYETNGYDSTDEGSLKGDLNRLQQNTLDEAHVKAYAKASGATEEQVQRIFELFFNHGFDERYVLPYWEFKDQ